MPKRTIDQVAVTDLRVLMRVDFNVPLEHGRITDDRRITQAMESMRSVINRGGKLILMSHLGRPKGRGFEAEFSLEPVAHHLAKLLEKPVAFVKESVGPEVDAAVQRLQPGGILLLENLRFHAEETLIDSAKKNSDKKPTVEQRAAIDAFAAALSKNADLYCNNAFGTCHRKHASMYDVPMTLGPGKRVVGHLVEKELRFLGDALAKPKRPFVAILGGAKVSDKIGVIENLLPKVDAILIGGAMTFTFLASQGIAVGSSLCERDKLDLAKSLLAKAGGKILLPTDSVCATELKPGVATRIAIGPVPDGLMGLDIGPATIAAFGTTLRNAKTIVWNGPMGVFETP
ncbi:MAG: phosphoglycerate kinase, partial [Planctomycetota bacterium]